VGGELGEEEVGLTVCEELGGAVGDVETFGGDVAFPERLFLPDAKTKFQSV